MSFYTKQNTYFKDAYIADEHGWPSTGVTPEVEMYIKRIQPSLPRHRRALDLGCGEGRHSVFLASRGFQVTGIDAVSLALTRARQAAIAQNVSARTAFRKGNVLNIKLPVGNCDVVVDYGCFHHILKRDWKAYIEQVTSVLKDEGYFILTVFTPQFKHFKGEGKRTRKWMVHRNHYDRFFTKADLRDVFKRSFDFLDMRIDAKGFCHALMQKK